MNAENHRLNLRYQVIVVGVGLALMAVKFFAWWLTNSNAVLTDALESIINVVAGFFAIYSVVLTAKPKDANHPYGHGKVEFLAAGFEGGLIAIAGLLIIGKAFYNLVFPQPIQKIDIGLVLTAASGIVNFGLGFALFQQGKKSRSLTLQADGKHLLSDAYSSGGVIAGMGLVWLTGLVWVDNATALIFGFVILYTGYKLLRSSVAGIMDETDLDSLRPLAELLARHRRENWVDLHNLRAIRYGPSIHIDCHLTVPWYFTVEQGHAEVKMLEEIVQRESPMPVEFFVHADPCTPPAACAICSKKECAQRRAPQEREVPWTLEHLLFVSNHQDYHHMPKA